MPPVTDAAPASGQEGEGTARILDAGYRRYAGTRMGLGHAVRSLIATTLRRILGLRRPARTKILPVMTIMFAYLPAIVFVGLIALFNRFGAGPEVQAEVIPDYSEYYGFIISAIVLFVTFVAPEALCPDRRSRVLSLYLSSPLTRMTYLGAKATSIAIVLASVTIGPPLLLLFGLALQGEGPDGVDGFFATLARIIASGTMMAIVFTAVSIGIASLTDRRAIAAAATLLVLVGSQIVAGALHFGLDAPDETLMISLTEAPIQLVFRIYGESDDVSELSRISTAALSLGTLAWTALGAGTAIFRYRSLQVTR